MRILVFIKILVLVIGKVVDRGVFLGDFRIFGLVLKECIYYGMRDIGFKYNCILSFLE